MKSVKRSLLFFACLFAPVAFCISADAQVPAGISKVVIDAGHGGKDPGTVHQKYYEKDINLAVALRLGALIGERHPDVEVLYTRKTDTFVPLAQRTDMANKAGADLFISIHVNANKSTSPSGTETYVMGVDKAGKNLDIAMKENDVIVYEEDYSTRYQGYVPGSSESLIIFSLMQYSYQGQSLNLAAMVQAQYGQRMKMNNRGVKQAGFLVLYYAVMPSILTELGFLSHAEDRKKLLSKDGQENFARSLLHAFSEYKARSEGLGGAVVPASGTTPVETSDANSGVTASERPVVSSDVQAEAGGLVYRVQILSSSKKTPKNSSLFGRYRGEVKEIVVGNLYKYYHGEASSYQEALSLLAEVRQVIPDAFPVAFQGDRQVSLQEARQLENKKK